MKKNRKFNSCQGFPGAGRASIAFFALLFLPAAEQVAFAQGDFAAPPLQQPASAYTSSSNWQRPQRLPAQPASAHQQYPATIRMRPAVAPAPLTPALSIPQPSVKTAWPETAIPFDDFVQKANLEMASDAPQHEVAQAFGSTMDSAGQMLGSLKSKIGGKAESLFNSDAASSVFSTKWLSGLKESVSPDTGRMLGSLALVLGGYFAFVAVMRKFNPRGATGIPAEVVEVMGYLPYGGHGGKQNLQLVRLGSKLLLLINGPDGTHPIGEITDAGEVEYLSSMCRNPGTSRRATQPARGAAAVQQIVRQSENRNPDTRTTTNEGLAEVLRRLDRATGGSSANFEA